MILDDDNTLFGEVRESIDFPKLLDKAYTLYSIRKKINFDEMYDVIEKLPHFNGFKWVVTSLTSVSLVLENNVMCWGCGIYFFNQTINEKIMPYFYIRFPSTDPGTPLREIQNNIKMLFNLYNGILWEYKNISYTEQYTYRKDL